MNRLRTPLGEQLYEAFKEPLRQFLREVDARIGTDDFGPVETLHATLELEKKKNDSSPDAVHDDLFTLGAYVCFFEAYGRLWRLIKLGKFSESWGALQDCLDYLSTVRRFSEIDICAFEDQLVELEKTYPYNIFLSAGLIVDAYECTLCGQDINSLDCIHRMGHLYRGQVAQAKPRKILQLTVQGEHVDICARPMLAEQAVLYTISFITA
jgi:hypothetical protein